MEERFGPGAGRTGVTLLVCSGLMGNTERMQSDAVRHRELSISLYCSHLKSRLTDMAE